MTGVELAGAAVSAAAKGVKTLGEDETTRSQLARLSEGTPEMKAAATAYAKRVAIRQQIVLQVMRPLGRLAGFSKTYFENGFSEDLAEKLADVPDDQVESPPPTVAVPAMQALGYSLEEPDLKEMYLNLLANASDRRRSSETHPAFPEVIKQLSGAEARLLGQVLRAGMLPMVKVKTNIPASPGHQIAHHNLIEVSSVVTGEQVEHPQLSAWIDNWVRLGLLERDFANHFTDDGRYSWTSVRPEVVRLVDGGRSVSFDKGVLRTTDFGRRFASAVGSDEKAHADREAFRRTRESTKQAEGSTSVGSESDADKQTDPTTATTD